MKIAKPVEERLMLEIRTEIAKNPVITITAMQERLEKTFNRLFARQYVARMMSKVSGKAQSEIDLAKINKRVMQLRETHNIARERLMRILFWRKEVEGVEGVPRPAARDIVEATKNLVMLDIAVMNAEVANGVYKDLEEAAKQRDYSTLPPDQRQSIISAFSKWGFLPPGVTAQMTERQITLHARGTTPATNT